MAGGLDSLSAEGLNQLSRTINEAKELLKQQELLLGRTLEMEQRIIGRRVAGLKEYTDEYSKMLNNIATEQASLSAEMFKINEAGREAAANAEKAAKSAERAQANGNRSVGQTVTDEQHSKMGEAGEAEWENFANKRKSLIISEDRLKAVMAEREEERLEIRRKKEEDAHNTMLNLMAAREEAAGKSDEAKKARLNALKDIEISNIQAAGNAELKALELKKQMMAELEYISGTGAEEAAYEQKKYFDEIAKAEALNALQKELDKERAEFIYQNQLKNNGELNAAELAAFNEQLALRYNSEEALQKWIADYQKKQLDDEEKRREKEEKEERKRKESDKKDRIRQADQTIAHAVSFTGFSKEDNFLSRMESLRELRDSAVEDGADEGTANLAVAIKALSSLAQQLESKIDEIALYKGAIDTRMHGSSNETWAGSYWDQIVHDMTSVGAINPYFKQETFANKIKELVDSGIAFDLEQRAFLATISDKIATTFNVADSTLLRLVRIQQQDSTAGRLGMEAALNAFLNEMYENTEYLKGVAESVRSSLAEMEALMEGAAATEVEYQVQKWMGSLYSVGMSQSAVTSITNALGQIAAGQIEGLTGDGAGNLLIMAANDAGIPIADILAKGIDADETNALLQATVNYLAEIAEASQDNQVVQQQLANVFGVKASDLRAATNLASKGSVSSIYDSSLSYDNMLYYLNDMASSMGQRTSLGEMMTNVWSNVQYSLAGSMASNPMSYILYKVATLLDNTAGGIAIPGISVMGNMVDLETTVADLMRVGAVGTGILGSIGSLAQGLGNSFSGSAMLSQLGISTGSGLAVTPRGEGGLLSSIGGGKQTTSGSGYVGNASGSDVKNSTMQEAEDSKKQLMVEAQENAEETQIDTINATVLKIYELLDEVASGKSSFNVKVEGYGLTRAGSNGSSIAGVNSLDNLSSGTSISSQGSSAGGLSSGGVNSGGLGGSVSLSGWTTTV
jgi:hypothetical protein